ncbi:MAG: hypothetical protein IJJ45_07790 [Clostridia bacterium]|nr:hypothetical protein [Clostridia bacterium]
MEKIKLALSRFFAGRRGPDELSMAMLILGLIMSILGSITRFAMFPLFSMALYVGSIYRLLSRNIAKRYEENQKYLAVWNKYTGSARQFFVRLRNMKKFKYFRCPECHARLRLPRKVGEVTVTCGKCHHTFKQKA